MTRVITFKRGLDIKLRGQAIRSNDAPERFVMPASIAITPDDYTGIVPRLDIKEGDPVSIGQSLFHDKNYPDIRVVSPSDGTVKEIVRGERRKILRIILTPTTSKTARTETTSTPIDRIMSERLLLDSGLWTEIRQRPYGIIPRPGVTPRDIIITGFDSAPLAPDYEPICDQDIDHINRAVEILSTLTSGSVYLTMRPDSSLERVNCNEKFIIIGPHPAGNASVQLEAIKPVNKGDIVWTINLPTAIRIGKYLNTGTLDFTTEVALTGCQIESPTYIKTFIGADLKSLLVNRIVKDGIHHRIIAGNVLTGVAESLDGYLRYPYAQVTVIAEGDDVDEFMGWASLSPTKMSINRSFPSHFAGKQRYCVDARLLGGRRAMIMSGLYDKVLPMDIMVEFLIKACLSKNIERMEQLGIYEIIPEDLALCEYVDPSKLELQSILREALNYVYSELN